MRGRKTKKIRIFELEKTRIEVNSPRGLRRVEGVKEDNLESQMVRSLKLAWWLIC